MSQLYTQNMQLIEKRWPEIAAHIDQQDIEALDAQLVEAKAQTISINGIQLSSRYDALEEAFFYRSQTEGDVYFLFGVALGDIPKLLAHDPGAKEINIFVINPDIFKLVLHFTEQSWLADSRFNLHLVPAQHIHVEPFLHQKGTIILPSEKELCKRLDASLYYRLENSIVLQHMNASLLNEEQQEFDTKRLKENLPSIRQHKSVNTLVDKHRHAHKSVIVIGAGPTLEDNLPELVRVSQLKKHKRPLIIAVSMAGSLLLKQNIIPDILVHVDRGQGMVAQGKHLPDFIPFELASEGTALVYATLVEREIIEGWKGSAFYANLNTCDYDESHKLLPTDRLFIHGSVIAPAVHMAMSFATKNVYFMGMDFGFPDKKFHAGMSNDTHTAGIIMNESVLNGYDEEIETDRSYRTFLTGVESLVMSAPNLTFINCSRKGAKIKNTEYLDGKEIV
ncbi:hypothetical protein ACOMICROBIO_FLGHMIGD_02295 [Vibrio sp. B1FLJ16]|uniref:motility associated factor glycosyltransferase family protein n=1 Tax=Vibrio sp. B1FLJ16 TaxID=2751178 RepID=UPI0015F35E01|nr:6-hydroxymethylpterin diphosphokinase MptE-like protein [Vibrio sp. B1FLJ16]CAD7811113.1 hypothetical protein ACOMICROBIO_FLGHMIGD_02295 [Vibrio sp. B1FLJ16]CAE6914108.1 hypothetical protein ACOMICROBIO_FLGHMIGD_02295 [Vibrio sp. B1FLJ16]